MRKDDLPVVLGWFPALVWFVSSLLVCLSLHYQRDCLLLTEETEVHFELGAVVEVVHPGGWEISQ